MESSRTKNTLKNIKTGLIVQLINKVMAFVVRTIFIRTLGTEYLGINGLFTNILTILNFAELGIGTAIIFNMYKPIAIDDKEKIKSLMLLYKNSYNKIGCIIFLLGIMVIPFFNIIIKDVPDIKENIIFIYVLFLVNTSVSYFFSYKKSIISAYQQESIINNIDSVIYLLKNFIEIFILIFTKEYILYLSFSIFSTILENVIVAYKADKMFPFLKDKNVKELPKDERKSIFNNVKALIVYQFGGIIMDGTDNILISSMVNIATVGLCSNYTLIISSVKGVVKSALNGITASIGNLNAIGDNGKKESILYEYLCVSYFIYSFCSIALIILLNPFIELWLGNQYVLPISVPIALGCVFFVNGIRQPAYTYRITMGLFEKGKITPYIGAFSNIFFSIVLGKIFGVVGIYIATVIAYLLSYTWLDPYLIYKFELKKKPNLYIKKYITYFIVFSLEILGCFFISSFINTTALIAFILKIIIVIIVPNLINLIVFYKTEEFGMLKKRFITPIFNKIKSKIKKESN